MLARMPSMRRLLAVQAHLETTAATPEPAAATTELADLTLDDFMAMDKDRALLGKTFDIPTRREQAALRKQWIEERVTNILPGLMDEVGVEYWVLSMKEYGEDTAWRAMTPSETVAARRRSCIVYRRTAGGVEKETFVAKSDPALGWEGLFEEQIKPHLEEGGGRIAINVDAVFAFADGMHAGEKEAFVRGVGPEVMERVVSERLLPIYFLMLRAPTMNATPELPTVHGSALPTGSGHHYTNAVELSHSIIVEAMSAAVITPGSTTCADVSWWTGRRRSPWALTAGFSHRSACSGRGRRARWRTTRSSSAATFCGRTLGSTTRACTRTCSTWATCCTSARAARPRGCSRGWRSRIGCRT